LGLGEYRTGEGKVVTSWRTLPNIGQKPCQTQALPWEKNICNKSGLLIMCTELHFQLCFTLDPELPTLMISIT